METAIDINVIIPQTAGTSSISLAELKSKVQAYVNSLYSHTLPTYKKTKKATTYSERINRLRAMSHEAVISEQDIKEDDRLAYLLSK